MDRSVLEQHLALAQQHVIEGMDHLARQETIVAELERDGHDTAEALKVLATLRDTQKLHEQEVERIMMELKQQVASATTIRRTDGPKAALQHRDQKTDARNKRRCAQRDSDKGLFRPLFQIIFSHLLATPAALFCSPAIHENGSGVVFAARDCFA